MKRVFSLVFIALIAILLVACGNNNEKSEKSSESKTKGESKTITVDSKYQTRGEKEDGSDAKNVEEKVKVPVNPKKVVVLDYGALDAIEALGGKEAVKAVPKGENDAMLPEFLKTFKDKKYENIGTLKEVNYEKVAEVKPDLILFSGRTASTKVLDELDKAAPDAAKLYVGPDMKDYINSVKDNTLKLGKIFSNEDKAKSLNKELDDKIKDVKAKAEKTEDKSMFLLVNEGELAVFGPGSRFGELLHGELGLKASDENVKQSRHGQPVSYEYLSEKNPDIIFAMDRAKAIGGKATSKEALSNDVIKDVNAVKNNKVVDLDPQLWYLSTGGVRTTMKQIDEVEKGLK